jgi:nicotinamidase/pyrazinamidase
VLSTPWRRAARATAALYARRSRRLPSVATVDGMPVAYDDRTVLLVVDVQNDFADPTGSLAVPGGGDVVTAVNDEVATATAAGAPVVYTRDWHPPRTPHFAVDGGPWPVHCVRGTWGAAFHPDLVVVGEALHKGTGGEDGYSAFTMRDHATGADAPTGLDALLRSRGVTQVAVVGLALDYCVKHTALDAVALGYGCTVRRRATAPVEVEPGDGAAAEAELIAAGVVVDTS